MALLNENLLLPLGLAVLAGIILLVIEYRTKWFARYASTQNSIESAKNDNLVKMLDVMVTPAPDLANQTGDWLQIADELKGLLDKNTMDERLSPVTLEDIEINKLGATIEYQFWGKDEHLYWVRISVNAEGRILDLKRDCMV